MTRFSSFPKADAPESEPALKGPELEFADGAPGAPAAPAPPVDEMAQFDDIVNELDPNFNNDTTTPGSSPEGEAGVSVVGDSDFENELSTKTATPADTVTDEFIAYLHKVEGGEQHINPQGRWMPYNTDGAGKWTIGRGHLINDGESPKGWEAGLSSDEVEELFNQDVIAAAAQARKAVGAKAFDALPLKMRQLLVDFSFNLGSSWSQKFPKMTRAILAGDMEGAYNQMERWKTAPSGAKSRLKGRNNAVASFFFGKVDGDPAPDPEAPMPSDSLVWARP